MEFILSDSNNYDMIERKQNIWEICRAEGGERKLSAHTKEGGADRARTKCGRRPKGTHPNLQFRLEIQIHEGSLAFPRSCHNHGACPLVAVKDQKKEHRKFERGEWDADRTDVESPR